MANPRKSVRRRSATSRGSSLEILLNEASRHSKTNLRRVAAVEGLPVEFMRILEVLSDERGRSMSDVASAAGMQMSATSKVIDRMVDHALVQRSIDPDDQRRAVLHISDFGLKKISALDSNLREQRRRAAGGLSQRSEAQLRALLKEFIAAQRQAIQ